MTTSRHARAIRGCLLCLTLSFGATLARAQSAAPRLPLFAEDSTLEFTLEAPFRTLRRSARSREEFDGFVRYTTPAGDMVSLDVEVRVRGNSRLDQCDFPPLRLDFRRGQLDGTVFAGQNRLKLVTLCKRQERYRDYLALEHDIYLLFNALSDVSFRVRRANVTYLTSDARRPDSFTEPAFLIEEDWEVAARHELEIIHSERLPLDELDGDQISLLSLFQFVIGNTDWSALRGPEEEDCCHNGKVIGTSGGPVMVVPYDFDQAGLIDTEYSSPAPGLRIRSVTQRLYRGFCMFNSEVDEATAFMLERRSAMEDVLRSSTASAGSIEEALEFLQDSLATLEDPAQRNEEILQKCRG